MFSGFFASCKVYMFLILALLLHLPVHPASAEAEELELIFAFSAEVEIREAVVTLQDLVEIYSRGRVDLDLITDIDRRLATIEVAQAPLPGSERRLGTGLPRHLLLDAGFAEEYGVEISVETPDEIMVRRKAEEITPESLEEAASSFISDYFGDSGSLEIESRGQPQTQMVPAGSVELEVSLSFIENLRAREQLLGLVTIPVEIHVDEEPVRTIYTRFRVRLWREALVAARDLDRGTVLTAEDVVLVEREVTRTQAQIFDDPEDVEGYRTRRSISEGVILSPEMLELPPLISRGDRIKIVVNVGGVQIEDWGEAREDGQMGQEIPVRNISSGKILSGVVISSETVEVKP